MIVKFKKLQSNAVTPSKAYTDDACFDLTAVSCEYDPTLDSYIYDTAIAIEIPKDHVGLIFPRSSIYKTPHMLANAVGVIDAGFTNSIKVIFKNYHIRQSTYDSGDRVAQLMIIPIPSIELEETDALSDSTRGNNGLGSSGR